MIETKRLIIKPLTYNQLVKYANADPSLEVELNVRQSNRVISLELKDALENTIIPNVVDPNKNYLFSTLWTAISKTENQMVGEICFYGEPNQNGEVEIGYGTYPEFQNRGFMSEMVAGIIEWTKTQLVVKSILASTESTNIASFKVLLKNSFIQIGSTNTLMNWQLEIKP